VQIFIANKQNLSKSQIDGLSLGSQTVSGALVLDDDEKVIRYPSNWLSTLLDLQEISYKSAETYGRNTIYFLKFLIERPEYVGLTPDDILLRVNRSVLEDWIIRQQDSGLLDRSTIRNRESSVRSLYDFLSDNERQDSVLEKSPFPKKYISAQPHKKQVVSASLIDLLALMYECRYERDRLLLQFMYDAGVRISEVERITFGDIQKAIRFTNSAFVNSEKVDVPVRPGYAPVLIRGAKGRGGSVKERFAVVTTATLKRIASYHSTPLYKRYQQKYRNRHNFPAFLNTEGNPYNEDSLAKMIERRSDKALKKGRISKTIHAHLFRHASAYLTLEDPDLGEDFLDRLVNVQKTLGHSSITTTERYTSIPHDIYNSIADSELGALRTKIDKMEKVVEQTKLRIKPGDRK